MFPPPISPHIPHYLVCASAAHCAQLLRLTAQAHVSLHGLEPCTTWPQHQPFGTQIIWAMAPDTDPDAVIALQTAWRAHLMASRPGVSIRLLYGSAAQQARQMAQWQRDARAGQGSASTDDHDRDCRECLDAASERQLFRHLQTWTSSARPHAPHYGIK